LRYIIMLGGGLVFVYDLIPLVAAFLFAKRLPEIFAKAQMRMTDRRLKIISTIGVCVLLVQGALSFSDIDSGGWALVFIYIVMVLVYIHFRSPHNLRATAAASSSHSDENVPN
jgi:uncharacterized membrane protein